jgi:predicted small secreted protein
MDVILKVILISLLSSLLCILSGCNTTKGLSHDINQTSDSIHRTINS